MKKLLIIRSISFQQLDLNLPEIMKKFNGYEISILTHSHGAKLAETYKDIQHIYVYEHTESFSKKRKSSCLNGKCFDALLIPVSNLSGSGFNNVLSFATTIQASEKYICNLVSDIWQIRNSKINLNLFLTRVYKLLAFVVTVIFFPFLLLFMLFIFTISGIKQFLEF